jgi:hypothetical protein
MVRCRNFRNVDCGLNKEKNKMALQKSITTEQGFECPQAYIVIVNLHFQKGRQTLASALSYKDKASRDAGNPPIGSAIIHFDMDLSENAKNAVEQAYVALKALPEMAEAIDV